MSRDKIVQSTDNSQRLTAVIPVANLKSNIENLKFVLIEASKFNIFIILVIDLSAQQDSDVHKTIEEITRFSSSRDVEILQAEFGNPGAARNFGKNYCQTEWVTFWDADDQPNCKEIVNALETFGDDSDLIIGNYEVCTLKSRKSVESTSLIDIGINPGFWRIIFRYSLVQDIRFPIQRMGEDQLFLIRCRLEKYRVKFSRNVFYTYNTQSQNRLSRSPAAIAELKNLLRVLDEEVDFRRHGEYAKIINLRLRFSHIKYVRGVSGKINAFLSFPWNQLFSLTFLRVLKRLTV